MGALSLDAVTFATAICVVGIRSDMSTTPGLSTTEPWKKTFLGSARHGWIAVVTSTAPASELLGPVDVLGAVDVSLATDILTTQVLPLGKTATLRLRKGVWVPRDLSR